MTEAVEDPMVKRRAEKRAKVEEALKDGPVGVRYDVRHPDLKVPAAGRVLPALNFSPRYKPDDLVLDERGIAQTLQFGEELVPCFVPWDAIWSVEAEKGNAGCGFFAEACPPDRVAKLFDQSVQLQAVVVRQSLALNEAIKLHDSGAGSGAWRRWRDSLRQPAAHEATTPRKLELVKG